MWTEPVDWLLARSSLEVLHGARCASPDQRQSAGWYWNVLSAAVCLVIAEALLLSPLCSPTLQAVDL